MTRHSEIYVAVPDCQTVNITRTAALIECRHFPDNNRDGLNDQMWVPLALLHREYEMPPSINSNEVSDLVVLKRFVISNNINNYEELPEDDR